MPRLRHEDLQDRQTLRGYRTPIEVGPDEVEPSGELLEEALLAWQLGEAVRRIGAEHRRVLVVTCCHGRPCAEAVELENASGRLVR